MYIIIYKQKIRTLHQSVKSSDYSFLVGRDGFEPSKSLTADLQSAPFGHSGTYPYKKTGAGGRTRTPDLLITNQLLYQLSYTSISLQRMLLYHRDKLMSIPFFKKIIIYFSYVSGVCLGSDPHVRARLRLRFSVATYNSNASGPLLERGPLALLLF